MAREEVRLITVCFDPQNVIISNSCVDNLVMSPGLNVTLFFGF